MPTVREILKHKGHQIHCVSPDVSVLEATQKMNDAMIGALVVTEGDRVVGIFTERDVLRRVVAAERSPSQTLVGEVMTTSVACCTEDTEIDDARGVMKNRRIRHLPVVGGDGRIVGLISIGDLNAYYAGDQEHTIHMLHDYLYGRM